MSKHPTLNVLDVEERAYQLNELFKVIDDNAHGIASDGEISINTIAFLGSQLASELAQYASDNPTCMPGAEASTPSKPGQCTAEEILRSYRETVAAAETLIRAINAADLKRAVPVAARSTIDDAVCEMMGHCDAARSDFLGGLNHE